MILPTFQNTELEESEFLYLRNLIEESMGICLDQSKRILLESRLQQRLRNHSLRNFGDYCSLLSNPTGKQSELPRLIDAVTTNKTDFFREPDHFHYLENSVILPGLANGSISRPFKVWSSACSSGEEVYTLAIVLNTVRKSCPGLDFSILGTDISEEILTRAQEAVYDYNKVSFLSDEVRNTFFLKGVNSKSHLVKFKNEYRARISFRKLNLLTEITGMTDCFDVIFCRNVLIYFSKQTQRLILKKMIDKLSQDGTLILGLSESVTGLELPLIQTGPSIYKKG